MGCRKLKYWNENLIPLRRNYKKPAIPLKVVQDETQLLDIATGTGNYSQAVSDFMSSNFDTTDVQRPHAYLVWMLYDNGMKLIPQGSGVKRVTDPNELRTLLQDDIGITDDGYLHAYVTNGSAKSMSFDNMLVSYLRGKTRQINHYYPYGLSISGLGGDYDEYLNKYTSKELQTGEFDPSLSTGLEMFDFHARFYDPQLGRWFTPDPAEQFSNPYLAMGNNPVMYVDPNGEIAFMAVVGIFAAVQLGSDMIRNDFKMNIGEIGMSVGLGALQGALAFSGAGGLGAYAGCGAGWLTLGTAVAGQINIPVYEGDNFSLSISPSLATGTNGVRLGANAFASYRNGDFSISGGYSFGRNFSSWDLSEQMAEARWSSISSISAGINGTAGGFNLGLTKFGGNYPSTVGSVGFSKGRFGFGHENDFLAPNNQDRYRTGRLGFSWQATDDLTLTAGFEVLTGNGTSTVPISEGRRKEQYIEDVQLRNGISSFGVQYRGNDYRFGWNSEGARAFIQNGWHDSMHILGMKNSPWFERMSYPSVPYTYFGNTNPFTGYGF